MSKKEKKLIKRIKKLRKKLRNTPITVTSGPILRNPNTEEVIVSVLNEDDCPQKATVSVADTSMCPAFELPKEATICGELVTDPLPPSDTEIDLGMVFPPVTVEIPPDEIAIIRGPTLRIPLTDADTYEVKATAATPNINIKTWEDAVREGVAAPQVESPVILTDQVAISHLQAAFREGIDLNSPLQIGLSVAGVLLPILGGLSVAGLGWYAAATAAPLLW
ncbi:hypothetical protein [Oceanobacillus senegalensis]|uniref:hypothetical protein n=1 Tax=Oceanobacillus senegalensis TaxID=1936063 RepID=UPI000A30BDD3|nr:hypothetical protein [Oceanobacillus senegalensis]